MVFSYDVCNNSVQAGSTMMKHNEIGTKEKKDDKQKHLEIGKWSPANENVEVADIMPSVPLDIALLHIETDALLDSLRKSAITPQERTLSPSSTCSSTCSGISEGSQSPHNAAAVVNTSISMCSSTHSSAGLNDDLSECSSKDFSYNSGSDDPDDLSIDSDDGMKGEIRKLSRATNELNQSIANLLIEHEHSSDGEEVYEIQDMPDASHSHSHADSHADTHAHAHAHAHNSDETFALFIREMLSICEDFSKAFLRHQRIQDILRSKVLESLSKALRSNPRQAAYMYIILSAVVVTIRHQLKIL